MQLNSIDNNYQRGKNSLIPSIRLQIITGSFDREAVQNNTVTVSSGYNIDSFAEYCLLQLNIF